MSTPLSVSIVTPCLNHAEFIESTIQSVLSQSYPSIEYWVMDGGSNDGTLDIIKGYGNRLQWVSEPDTGQANAINKGLERTTGQILAYLNSDDLLAPDAIQQIVSFFTANPQAQLVYGDTLAIDEKGHPHGLRANIRPCDFNYLLNKGDAIVQPAAFWRRELWQELGMFDESYRYVFDYEYWLRAAQKHTLYYIPYTLAHERIHAAAKTSTGGLGRIHELERVGNQYGGNGIAANFRPEAAATYIHHAVSALRNGDRATARHDLRWALALNNSTFKLMLYLVAMLLFGFQGIPKLRLYSNKLHRKLPGKSVL
jgi:glycosyltransferase involved in cell wall biosynthesis